MKIERIEQSGKSWHFTFISEEDDAWEFSMPWFLRIDCKGTPKLELQHAPESYIPSLEKILAASPELAKKVLKTCIKNI